MFGGRDSDFTEAEENCRTSCLPDPSTVTEELGSFPTCRITKPVFGSKVVIYSVATVQRRGAHALNALKKVSWSVFKELRVIKGLVSKLTQEGFEGWGGGF